jgi:hypothetical protein
MGTDQHTQLVLKIFAPITLIITPLAPIILVAAYIRDTKRGLNPDIFDVGTFFILVISAVAFYFSFDYCKREMGFFNKRRK